MQSSKCSKNKKVTHEAKAELVTMDIFVFFGWGSSNQFEIVSETYFSCNAVGREQWLAIICSLLCPETDWNIRIGKHARLCLYFNGFKEVMF